MTVPPVPRDPPTRRFPWWGVAIPVVVSVVLAAVIRSPFLLVGAVAGPLMATAVWWEARRQSRRDRAQSETEYRRQLVRVETSRHAVALHNISEAERRNPSIESCVIDDLWRPSMSGNTTVRLGTFWDSGSHGWLPWCEDVRGGVVVLGDCAAARSVFLTVMCGLTAQLGEAVEGADPHSRSGRASWSSEVWVELVSPSSQSAHVNSSVPLVIRCHDNRIVSVSTAGALTDRRRVAADVLDPAVSELFLARCRPPDRDLDSRWADRPSSRPGIGYDERGEIRVPLSELDPHALIAGRTGSGKSEILIAVVAAHAQVCSPQQLSVMAFDFKGGATARRLEHLPHIVGVGTDMDAAAAEALLNQLPSEIIRRERVLETQGVGSMSESENPHTLLVMIDEFQAFLALRGAAEIITDIARRGRSLGLRLLLGTQNPAGVIRDAISANITTRVVAPMTSSFDEAFALGEPSLHRPIVGQALVRTAGGVARLATIRRVDEVAIQAIAETWTDTQNGGPPQWSEPPNVVSPKDVTERSPR
ncbi:MAG: hypothetical protein RL431_807 [Actinomycetota bacterium]